MFDSNQIIITCLIVLLAACFAGLVATLLLLIKTRDQQAYDRQSFDFLLHVANVDDITGLPTMTKFSIDAATLLSNAEPQKYLLGIISVDNLVYINDILGFKTSNRILRYLAGYLTEISSADALISRIGSDSFIMIAPADQFHSFETALASYHVQDNFPEMHQLMGDQFTLNFRVGIYKIDNPKEDLQVMMDYATIAKNSASSGYGNTIVTYSSAMGLDVQLKSTITLVMEKALADNEFVPYFQPQYSLRTGELIGAELLSRWHSSVMGTIFPSEFVPLFEQNGFIIKLDMKMFEDCCRLMRSWLDEGHTKLPRMSVNASRNTILDPGCSDKYYAVCQKYGIAPDNLEIELTESVLSEHIEEILSNCNNLRSMGFHLSLDDFGKAYSSLSLLKDVPADVLKLDRGFLAHAMDDSNGQAIIRNVISMAKDLRLETVAEGIETKEQSELLRSMGCDTAQGFYYARPMPPEKFSRILSISAAAV